MNVNPVGRNAEKHTFSITTEGMKNVAAGANPMLLKRGILAGTEALVLADLDVF